MSSFETLSANLRALSARKAEAQADAIRSTGQVYGGTLASIGERIAAIPAQQAELARIKAQAEEQQARAAERAQKAQEEAAAQEHQARLQGIFQKHGQDLDGAIGEILTVDPVLGMDLQKRKAEADKMAFDYKTKQMEAKRHELEFLGNLVGSAKDQNSYSQALYTAKAAGLSVEGIPPEYNPQVVEGINRALMTAKERLELDKPKPPEPFTLTPGSKRFSPDGTVLAEVPAASSAQGGFTLPPGGRRYDASGKLIASAPERPEKPSANDLEVDQLVETVIKNPALWDDLTPTVKGKIAGKLDAKGYTGFGKPLSNTAVKQIADSQTAIDSLKDLRTVLTQYEEYIGPVAGLSALNPYSKAREAQAKLDLVRQRVGKALEGGVLRKEDEEKYKKILATLRDTPDTAIYKVDQLIKSVENDVANFKVQQRLAGRKVNEPDAPAGIVEMIAPDGGLLHVPKADVSKYEALGARRK